MPDHLVIEVPVLEFGKAVVHAIQRPAVRAKSQGPHVMLVVTPRSPTGSQASRVITPSVESNTWRGQSGDGTSG